MRVSGDSTYVMSLLEPAIEGNKKFKFKVTQSKYNYIYFGVCQLNGANIKKDNIDNKKVHAAMMSLVNPNALFLGYSGSKTITNQILKFDVGEVI